MVGPAVVVADHYDEDQFVDASDDVSVWERAVFAPLYVDYGNGNPETVFEHPEPILETENPDGGDAGLNRRNAGVWGTDQTIPLVFEDRSAATTPVDNFEGDDWDLVVARTDTGDVDLGGAGDGALFRTERALDLLDEDADADFEIAGTRTFDGESMTVQYDPDEPGAYAFFLVNNGSVTVEDGDVTDVTDAKVIGVDTTLVHDARADVEPTRDSFEPGENVTFGVSSNHPNAGDEGLFTHAVLVYNESDFLDADGGGSDTEEVRLEFDGTADDFADADASDFTLHLSYGTVNGVVRTNDSAEILGFDLEERAEEGPFDVETLADALLQEVDLNEVETRTGDSVLNASLTIVCSTDSETTVEVGTTEDFAEGKYDVLYLSEGRDTGEFSTRRTEVEIASPPPDDGDDTPGTGPPGGGGGPPGGAPPGGGPPGDSPPGQGPPDDLPPGLAIDVVPNGNAASIAFENVPANDRTAVDLPGTMATDVAAVESIAINVTRNVSALEMETAVSSTVPGEETPWLDVATPLTYVEVTVNDSAVEYNEAEFTFTVSAAALEERGIAPEEVHLYRYDGDEWNQLPTEQTGEETYVATSPGFSVFAIGAQRSADFDVYDATVEPTEVEPGESVDVAATVENTGDEADSFRAELTVDGEVVTTTNVTLDPGESREVHFSRTFESPGTYDVAVSGEPAGTVTVEGDGPPGRPAEVGGLLSPLQLIVGGLLALLLAGGGAVYLRRSGRFDLGR